MISDYFNPRAPCGARPAEGRGLDHTGHFNPRAPCGARPGWAVTGSGTSEISTHAPLAGRDNNGQFIPHPATWLFQPTRPLRGATAVVAVPPVVDQNFNPRAPCGARLAPPLLCHNNIETISTHAPLAGRDNTHIAIDKPLINFNPRAPCGARRKRENLGRKQKYFNPRAPCGARRYQQQDQRARQ